MKRTLVLLTAAVFFLTATGGCVEQLLTVDTDPQGALVELNGQEMGRSPVTRQFTWYGTYEVVLRRDGYQTMKTTAKVIAPFYQWVPLDLISELLPIPLKDHHFVKFTLTPAPASDEPPPGFLDRADEMKKRLESSHYPTTKKTK